MEKIAFLFPGQGSQSVGMGLDLYQEYDFVRELFDMVDEVTRCHISRLCFKGPMEDLTATVNLQPALTAVNLSVLAALEKEGIRADVSAGHSLGEYSALCGAGVISAKDAVELVFKRGTLMHRESLKHKGAMHAIIGLPVQDIQGFIAKLRTDAPVSVANHNTEFQVVITGAPGPVEKVSEYAVSKGARTVSLKVSGAWHSELIKGAEEEFGDYLAAFSFAAPRHRVIHNVSADVVMDPKEIPAVMARQLCSPVRWYDSMVKLMAEEVEIFAEVGPGNVLTGLLRKILPREHSCKLFTLNNMQTLEKFFSSVT
ncbi:MAG: ACP S-malonyltransferase [Desulfobacterales bacterium]|nr:ACP S-malonyltransferase [Desulfobacterales bacterium]